jgi:choline dehydrogenase
MGSRSRDAAAVSEPDVIVCGAGTAGSVVAGRLAGAGARVLLLEAGPDFGPSSSGRWPGELIDAARLPVLHDWGYSGRGAVGQHLAFDRARVVGGCSAHNGCAQSVGWRGDYDRWAASGCGGWSGAELAPLFERASDRMRIRRFTPDEIQPFQRAFIDSSAGAGVPKTDDLDDLDGGIGGASEPMNVVEGVRWNASFAYLDPVRPGVEIRGAALVDRVLLDSDRAVGVRTIVEGRPHDVRAELVVLAAGAYGTPEILLRSGIGPVGDLRRVGIESSVELPGVGKNLHDQPAVELRFAGNELLRRDVEGFAAEHWLPEEQALAKIASPFCDGPYDLHVYPWIEPDAAVPSGWRCVIPVALLTPRSRGRLRLSSADPKRLGEPDHAYLAHPDDVPPLVAGVRWAMTLARSEPLARYLGEILDPPPLGDDALSGWIRSHHGHYWHPGGSCRMGPPDDPSSVVDADGRVIGVEGLRVADASIFPEIPRGTPALPTVVVGEHMADRLLASA